MTNSAEAIVAGHICLDMIPTIHNTGGLSEIMVPGKLIDVGAMRSATGGVVGNTGLALHRLGIATRLMGKVGGDIVGDTILHILKLAAPALADGMIVQSHEVSSYSIILNIPGVDRIIFHCPGANNTFRAADITPVSLAGARLLHFGYPPLMAQMFAADGHETAVLFQQAKTAGLTTSLDMALPDPASPAGKANWSAILNRCLPHVDIFLPSIDEILYMLGGGYHAPTQPEITGDVLREVSQTLLNKGVAIVVIKLGDQGLYLRTSAEPKRFERFGAALPANHQAWLNRELLTPCFKANFSSALGAGDCTIAGVLAGLLKGLSPEEVMRHAVAVGAFSVEEPEAISGVPHWDAVITRIQNGWEQHTPLRQLNDETR